VCNAVHRSLGLRALCVLSVLCGCSFCAFVCAAADIHSWAFEATIIHVSDPQILLGDVRLGDPVSGTFSYDVDFPPDASSNLPKWADYTFPGWFQGLRMVIENPRTGEELRYGQQSADFRDYFVSVFTESPFQDPGTSVVAFWETTTPPLPQVSSLVYMEFAGPTVLTQTALPTEYNVDDWPDAAIYFGVQGNPFAAIAQLHTLTPITPGDFNLDGKLDPDDYTVWRRSYGPTGSSEADWHRNGTVDAADYVVWRDAFNPMTSSNAVVDLPAVPEPAGLAMILVATLAIFVRRRAAAGRLRRIRRRQAVAGKRFRPDFGELRGEIEPTHPRQKIREVDGVAILTQQHGGVRTIDHAAGKQLEQKQSPITAVGCPNGASAPKMWSSVARAASVANGILPTRQVLQELNLRSLMVFHVSRIPFTIGGFQITAWTNFGTQSSQQECLIFIHQLCP
jgi:hypothetical protein